VGDVEQLIELGMGLAVPALLGIFGFLWRVHGKITAMEQRLNAHEERIGSNTRKLVQHFEKAYTIRKTIP
tara:strand:- start:874 stop:1083 length:210 start_codon:yes stop_codon:yes gene_type:complete